MTVQYIILLKETEQESLADAKVSVRQQCVYKARAKNSKSTICCFLLMVNSNRGRITYALRDIFVRRGWKSPFSPTVFWLTTPSGGTTSNTNVIYASLKSTFSGLQLFSRWQYRCIFIRLAAVATQICEITRNSEKIRTYSSSRSSKVINLGANRKRICNFLLVINSNFGRISYHFRDIDAWS